MKAKFFLLGLCALALAACSIDEVSQINDTNAVTFKATTATRAAAVTTNSIQSFTVWAWNGTNEFMDHVTATKQSNGTFTTSPYYFWPTGTVDFYALYPASVGYGVDNTSGDELAYIGGEITVNEDDLGGTHFEYTGNVATADIAEDNIVIEAYIPGTTDEQVDLCYAITKERSSGAVPMNFRHALSQVVFKAKDINADFVVDIAEVSICSVNKHGKYTLSGVSSTTTNLDSPDLGTADIAGTQGEWSGVDYLTRFEASCTPQTLDTEGTVVDITGNPLLLIPQEVEAWDPVGDYSDKALGSYIRVLCHVTEHGSTLWPNANEESEDNVFYPDTNNPETEYAYIAMPVDVAWEEGYRYTYTIIFGNGLGYYPPDDPNTDLEGTPVLVPITFNVTVDEFQDATGVDVPTDTDLSTISVSTQAQLEGAIHSGYQQIVLDADITLEGNNLVFDYDCELVLNGKTLTGVDYTADSNPCGNNSNSVIYITGGTLTVTGPGTITTNGTAEDSEGGYGSGDTDVFWVAGGNLIINGGTYYGGSWQDPTGDTYAASSSCVYVTEGFAYIYDGEFYSGWSKTLGAITILNCKNTPWEDGIANIYCYGGSYAWDPSYCTNGPDYGFVADGYGVVYNEETELYDVVYTTVTTAADLKALIAAGASEITVTEDLVLTDQIQVGSDLVLNLEASLTKESFEDGDNTEQNFFFWVGGGATLTINASNDVVMSSGGLNGNDADDWVGCVQVGGHNGSSVTTTGYLVINGGTYNGGVWDSDVNYNSVPTIYLLAGTVEINDGIFTGGLSNSFKSYGYKADLKDYGTNGLTECILNIYDASRESGEAEIIVKGGQFRNFDPSCNAVEGASTNFCPDGYTATKGDEDADGHIWFTVAKD